MDRVYVLNGPNAGESFALEDTPVYIGRSTDNHVVLEDRFVSRKHLKIRREGDRCFVQDLCSKNGTYVKGQLTKPGEEIQIEMRQFITLGVNLICIDEQDSAFARAYIETTRALNTWEEGEHNKPFLMKTRPNAENRE
ncbi:MAG: FHA domain-containing protein [Deltaproteobacteria bacterium]|jgi:pSer/pThr/pTyr-binding forkhead associated (FHA) protein